MAAEESTPDRLHCQHFRADTPTGYAAALLALIRHARDSSDDYTFGPVNLAACDRDGLTVTGPDLAGPHGILAGVAGLAQLDESPRDQEPPVQP